MYRPVGERNNCIEFIGELMMRVENNSKSTLLSTDLKLKKEWTNLITQLTKKIDTFIYSRIKSESNYNGMSIEQKFKAAAENDFYTQSNFKEQLTKEQYVNFNKKYYQQKFYIEALELLNSKKPNVKDLENAKAYIKSAENKNELENFERELNKKYSQLLKEQDINKDKKISKDEYVKGQYEKSKIYLE